MKEVFKDIPGYEGLYQVSNLGRVKSLNYLNTKQEKILKFRQNNCGYLYVTLSKNGIAKCYSVHRLVARTFIENPANLPQVNHIDQNKQNNCALNLEWCTVQYNTRYSQAKKVGCYKEGELVKVYDAIIDVEKDGFKRWVIKRCCNNKSGYKSSGGYQWKYLD